MRTKNMKYESKGIMKEKMKNMEMRREKKKLALKKLEISYDSPFFLPEPFLSANTYPTARLT